MFDAGWLVRRQTVWRQTSDKADFVGQAGAKGL